MGVAFGDELMTPLDSDLLSVGGEHLISDKCLGLAIGEEEPPALLGKFFLEPTGDEVTAAPEGGFLEEAAPPAITGDFFLAPIGEDVMATAAEGFFLVVMGEELVKGIAEVFFLAALGDAVAAAEENFFCITGEA